MAVAGSTGGYGPAVSDPVSDPVPVLLYHAVTDRPGSLIAPFTVTRSVFERQLDAVQAAGFRCITFSQLVQLRHPPCGEVRAHEGAGIRAGERVAVITFDDGYPDFATAALPALRERSMDCTLFVTTGWLDGGTRRAPGPGDRMLAWSQLAELEAAGVEIGAHSHSHPQLDTLDPAALQEEMSLPRALLEDALGHVVPSVAYPHGYHGPRVRRSALRAGYSSGAAVRNRVSGGCEDPLRVSRLMVAATTTEEEFSSWLRPPVHPRQPVDREFPGTTAWRVYRRTRAVLRGVPGSDYR